MAGSAGSSTTTPRSRIRSPSAWWPRPRRTATVRTEDTELTPAEALAGIVAWAEREEAVRALLLLGSRARTELPADAWSDTDLLVLTTDAERWLADGAWLEEVGEVVVTFTEPTGLAGLVERRVLFADAVDVDLVPVPIDRIPDVLHQHGALPVLARGHRVLVDKDGRLAALAERLAGVDPAAVHGAASWPPTPVEVENAIASYLYHCIWTAKKLRRGELWVAVDCQNGFQARTLRRFVEWQAKARSRGSATTFYEGRFLERWADADALAAIGSSQSRYDAGELARTIPAALTAFEPIAREVAAAAGARYPDTAHREVAERLALILDA